MEKGCVQICLLHATIDLLLVLSAMATLDRAKFNNRLAVSEIQCNKLPCLVIGV